MPGKWGYGPKEFSVGPGQSVVRLDVPHRGEIKTINLQQVGGADDATLKLYDSEQAAKVFTGSSSSSAVEGGDPEAHLITEPKAVAAGVYQEFGLSIDYINRDGTPTNPVRRLWMLFDSQAAGETTWSLSMMIEPASLDG